MQPFGLICHTIHQVSLASEFNFDFGVSYTPEQLKQGPIYHNYKMRDLKMQELSGLSVFYTDGNDVYHTYSTFGRGDELLVTTYHYVDLTPKGRQEHGPHKNLADWVRLHDRYPRSQFHPVKGSGFDRERLRKLPEVLQSHVDRGLVTGLTYAVDCGSEFEVRALGHSDIAGEREMLPDDIFRIASLSKPVTAVAAMMLVEDGVLRLDDPVEEYFPEFRDLKVLRAPESPVDDTVAMNRSLTLRDLLTQRCGWGAIMAPPDSYPAQSLMAELGVAPSPDFYSGSAQEYVDKISRVPLFHQPGEGWLYESGMVLTGILIERATGQTLEQFMRARIFAPLGMKDTGFQVPEDKHHRLPDLYTYDRKSKQKTLMFEGRYLNPPEICFAAGGLVSTASDYLAFCRMMRDGGKGLLSPASIKLMTSDQITKVQRKSASVFFSPGSSWGFGMEVCLERHDLWSQPGRFGWNGGYGTTAYTDPANDFIGVLLTQRMMDSPRLPEIFVDFWNLTYQALR